MRVYWGTMMTYNTEALSSSDEQHYIRMFNHTGNAAYKNSVVLSQKAFLYRYAQKYTNDPDLIEDMVQEGFIQVLKAFDSYNIDAENSCLFRSYYSRVVKGIMGGVLARQCTPFSLTVDLRNIDYDTVQKDGDDVYDITISDTAPSPEQIAISDEIKQIASRLF